MKQSDEPTDPSPSATGPRIHVPKHGTMRTDIHGTLLYECSICGQLISIPFGTATGAPSATPLEVACGLCSVCEEDDLRVFLFPCGHWACGGCYTDLACDNCIPADRKRATGAPGDAPAQSLAALRSHQWTGCQQGGNPADATSYEWVRYCKICGMEDTCEDPLPPCPGPDEAGAPAQGAETRWIAELSNDDVSADRWGWRHNAGGYFTRIVLRDISEQIQALPIALRDIATLREQLAAEQQEHERTKRTMKHWEESYLAEHENWGVCKWRLRCDELRSQLEQARADGARVDYVLKNGYNPNPFDPRTKTRQALDVATQENTKPVREGESRSKTESESPTSPQIGSSKE